MKKPNKKTCTFSEYRNWIMICYLLGTGNRLTTLSNLKVKDIDFDNHEVALRKVKNKKQHTIPLTLSLEQALADYLRFRKGKPDDYLFCNQYGSQLHKNSITTAIIDIIIPEVYKKQVYMHLGIHSQRTGFLTEETLLDLRLFSDIAQWKW